MSSVSTVIARRQRDIARREQAMLDAAQALIQRDGLLSLQMARVAEESGYAIGTLYKHFASKEDLLVTLATRERSLIPLFGSGVISIRNLDTMMRNTGDMIDAARRDGRLGYNRAAQRILETDWTMPILEWLDRHLGLRRPLENALSDRFELLLCRRAVLEQLRRYNQASIGPLLSGRMTVLLDSVLATRIERLDQAVDQMRARFPEITVTLEKRLLLLQGLRDGARVIDRIRDESLISPEVADRIQRTMRASWRIALTRPPHRLGGRGRRQDGAPDTAP